MEAKKKKITMLHKHFSFKIFFMVCSMPIRFMIDLIFSELKPKAFLDIRFLKVLKMLSNLIHSSNRKDYGKIK